MAVPGDLSDLMSLKEACEILKTHPNTLRQWDKKGILKAIRFGQRRDRHYKKSDVLRLIAQYRPSSQNLSESSDNSAFGNEMRLQKAEEGLNRLSRIQVITAALLQALTPADVARVLIDQGMLALKCSSSLIINYNDKKNYFEVFGFSGFSQEMIEKFRQVPIDTPSPWTDAFRSGDSIFIESFEECMMRYPHVSNLIYQTYNQAIAAVPLSVAGQPFGVLHISFSVPQRFTPDHTSFIMTLARQCAMALDRTRLYESEKNARFQAERVQQLMQRSYEAGLKMLIPTSIAQTYQTVVEEAKNLLQVDHGSIFIAEDGELKRRHNTLEALQNEEPRKEGQTYQCYKEHKPIIYKVKEENEPHKILNELGIRSVVRIPLSYENKSIGVLNMYSSRKEGISSNELTALSLFGATASLAILKAQEKTQ